MDARVMGSPGLNLAGAVTALLEHFLMEKTLVGKMPWATIG